LFTLSNDARENNMSSTLLRMFTAIPHEFPRARHPFLLLLAKAIRILAIHASYIIFNIPVAILSYVNYLKFR